MINTFITKIGVAMATGALALLGWFGIDTNTQPSLGSVVPVTPAIFETALASPIGISDTSMTLANATLISGATLTGYTCFTVDSGQPNLEYMCGTASGTAITSMTRGIDPLNGTSSVTALKFTHRRGADVKITDYPALSILGRIANGLDGFAQPVRYDTGVTNGQIVADSRNLVNYSLLAATAIAGGVPASTSVLGISKLSTTASSSTNPIVVGDNDTRVPTQAENDAMAGTSGTAVSSSNKFVDNADTSTSTLAGKVVRWQSNGNVAGTATPVLSTDLTSKSYVDAAVTQPKFSSGSGNFAANSSTTLVTGFSVKQLVVSAYSDSGRSISHGSWTSSTTAASFAASSQVVNSQYNQNGGTYGLGSGATLSYTNDSNNLTNPCTLTVHATTTTSITLSRIITTSCTQYYVWEAYGY